MINKNAKFYIAGHTGMVGSSVLRCFQKEGFDNLLLRTQQELDLLRQDQVERFFENEKPEYVVLCAARVGGISANMTFPSEFLYQNLQIQNNVIWAALKHDVKKLLFLGSSCIYPRDCDQPMREDYLLTGPLEPTNEGYALAKISGIKLCEKIYDQYGKTFISCMPTNIYGPGDNFDQNSSHVIPALITRMHKAKVENEDSVVIWGSGESRREFLYVDDLADAIHWLMSNYDDRQFLNIGTGKEVSIMDLAFLIKDVVGFDGELVFDVTKPDGMPRKLLDVSKMSALGWIAKVDLIDGLRSEYDYYLRMSNE